MPRRDEAFDLSILTGRPLALLAGRVVVAGSAVLLLASLFLPWYELVVLVSPVPGRYDGNPTGWESFESADVGLAAIAVVTAALAVAEWTLGLRILLLPIALLGALAVAVVLYSYYRPAAFTGQIAGTPPNVGWFAALCGGGGVTVGGLGTALVEGAAPLRP